MHPAGLNTNLSIQVLVSNKRSVFLEGMSLGIKGNWKSECKRPLPSYKRKHKQTGKQGKRNWKQTSIREVKAPSPWKGKEKKREQKWNKIESEASQNFDVSKCNTINCWCHEYIFILVHQCPPLTEPDNGQITPYICKTKPLHGETCLHECKPGFRVVGPSSSKCDNGHWRNVGFYCQGKLKVQWDLSQWDLPQVGNLWNDKCLAHNCTGFRVKNVIKELLKWMIGLSSVISSRVLCQRVLSEFCIYA